jgi:hypothetical protein
MKSFVFRLTLLTLLILAAGAGLRAAGLGYWVHPQAGALVAYYTILTYLTYALIERGRRTAPDALTGYYMGALTFRLLLSMGIAVAFIWTGADGREAFLMAFFLLYFLYAGFEVWAVVRNLRPNSG